MKQNRIAYLFLVLRFVTAFKKFKLDDDTFYHRRKKVW